MSPKLRIFLIYATGWVAGAMASILYFSRDWEWDVLGVIAVLGFWFVGRAVSKIIGGYDA